MSLITFTHSRNQLLYITKPVEPGIHHRCRELCQAIDTEDCDYLWEDMHARYRNGCRLRDEWKMFHVEMRPYREGGT